MAESLADRWEHLRADRWVGCWAAQWAVWWATVRVDLTDDPLVGHLAAGSAGDSVAQKAVCLAASTAVLSAEKTAVSKVASKAAKWAAL